MIETIIETIIETTMDESMMIILQKMIDEMKIVMIDEMQKVCDEKMNHDEKEMKMPIYELVLLHEKMEILTDDKEETKAMIDERHSKIYVMI